MANLPPNESLMLVSILPSTRDLEIARILGWYRIPLTTAPKVVDVDFLAFYQTDAFGEKHRWRIEYFAEVRGHELTTRAELFRDQKEHPRAHQEYYQIRVGPLIQLERPIMAGRWRRITFLYTTGELFQKAEVINDLVVKLEERQILWRSLRERALRGVTYQTSTLPEDDLDLDPDILMMLGDLGSMAETQEEYKTEP